MVEFRDSWEGIAQLPGAPGWGACGSPGPLGLESPQEQEEEDGVKGRVGIASHCPGHGEGWELAVTLGSPFSISAGADPAPLTHRFTAASASWR